VVGEWHEADGVPLVRVTWTASSLTVVEEFFCPCLDRPRIARRIMLLGDSSSALLRVFRLRCRQANPTERAVSTRGEAPAQATLVYEIRDGGPGSPSALGAHWEEDLPATPEAVEAWMGLTTFRTPHAGLNHLFRSARNQLPTAIDKRGRMDGSIWQYNLEWVRDQAHVAEALVLTGGQEQGGDEQWASAPHGDLQCDHPVG